MKDGYTTGGGLGLGLGGAKRLSQRVRHPIRTRHRAPSSRWRAGSEHVHRRVSRSPARSRRPAGWSAISPAARAARRRRVDEVAIVVTELATNLLKHGGGGHIHRRVAATMPTAGAGGAGAGPRRRHGRRRPLHARRLLDRRQPRQRPRRDRAARRRSADLFAARPGHARSWPGFVERPARRCAGPMLGAALAPYPGETVCGDNWSWRDTAQRPHHHAGRRLGHGVEAARAAEIAVADVPGERRCGLRGARRADPSRARADARRARSRSRGSTGGAAWSASPASATSARVLVNAAASAPHGVAQRHGRARRAAHPRVHLSSSPASRW